VPDFRLEPHLGRLERVGVGNLNVDLVRASCVWRVWRRGKRASEMIQADSIDGRSKDSRVVSISLDVGQLLCYTAISAARHGGRSVVSYSQ
jgi:hypothetical protein